MYADLVDMEISLSSFASGPESGDTFDCCRSKFNFSDGDVIGSRISSYDLLEFASLSAEAAAEIGFFSVFLKVELILFVF